MLNICCELAKTDNDVELHALGSIPQIGGKYKTISYPRHQFPHPALGRSPEMLKGLKSTCVNADIVHSNSLWMMPNIYPWWAIKECRNKKNRPKLVISPHGTLAEWALARSKWGKRIIGWCGQYTTLQKADMFFATCEKEYREIRRFGLNQPVAIIPIGMNLPDLEEMHAVAYKNTRRHLLFFGRIHEVKAIDILVEAWGKLAKKYTQWDLQIAGPDGGARAGLEKMSFDQKIPRVEFVGEINGSAKYEFLASGDLCVLPSKTENFAVTVAESLASGTPVVASKGTPWKDLDSNGCGWWGFTSSKQLAAILERVLAMSHDELKLMGEKGRNWIQRDFSWRAIAEKTIVAYSWLCNRGDEPPYVKIS